MKWQRKKAIENKDLTSKKPCTEALNCVLSQLFIVQKGIE